MRKRRTDTRGGRPYVDITRAEVMGKYLKLYKKYKAEYWNHVLGLLAE